MNDDKLDRLVSAATVSDAALEQLDLTNGEAHLLETILMGDHDTTSSPSLDPVDSVVHPRRRHLRRGVVITGIVGALALTGGAVAATTLLDSTSNTIIDTMDCGINSKDATRVATARAMNGNSVDFWVIRSAGGSGDLVVERTPDGRPVARTLGCGRITQHVRTADTPFAAMPRTADDKVLSGHLIGWVPPATAAVAVILGDGTRVDVTPEPSGYFLKEVTLPASSMRLADPVSMDLFDASGAVIQRVNP